MPDLTTEPMVRRSVDDAVADLLRSNVAALGAPAHAGGAQTLARSILDLLGSPDEPGPLDHYQIRVIETRAGTLIVWFCAGPHSDSGGDGTVGIIARDLDGDQTGLTLGELLESVLSHDRDEHGKG